MRYVLNDFKDDVNTTISADHFTKEININGLNLSLQLWDSSDYSKYQFLQKIFYPGSHGVVFVFDLTQPESFDHVDFYYKEITEVNGPIPSILIGNKCDIINDTGDLDIKKIEELYNTKYFEVSALSGKNVNEAFEYIAMKSSKSILEEKERLETLLYNELSMQDENINLCNLS